MQAPLQIRAMEAKDGGSEGNGQGGRGGGSSLSTPTGSFGSAAAVERVSPTPAPCAAESMVVERLEESVTE